MKESSFKTLSAFLEAYETMKKKFPKETPNFWSGAYGFDEVARYKREEILWVLQRDKNIIEATLKALETEAVGPQVKELQEKMDRMEFALLKLCMKLGIEYEVVSD